MASNQQTQARALNCYPFAPEAASFLLVKLLVQ